MLDGGLYQALIEVRDIQGVPSVCLNGELFANGKVDAAALVDKLLELYPGIAQVADHTRLPLQDVAVIGGGDSGIEAALDLAGIVRSVTVFEFLPELKADRLLIEQAEKRDNITIVKNMATRQIVTTDGKVSAIAY